MARMKTLLLAAIMALSAAWVDAGVSVYNYRVVSSAIPSARTPRLFICDTEAERPATLVADGDLAYTKDTDILWLRSAAAWVDITSGGGGGGHVIEDEGIPLAARANLNFTGAGVTCTDSTPDTICNIPGGGGSLTVEEADSVPTVAAVDTIQFDQADGFTVTDETGGNVQVDLTITDALVPNNITIDLATLATTANAGDSATSFFPAGEIEIARGGTGQATAQLAINALTAVSGATNEYVLTKDTATGNAIFKAAAAGSGGPGVSVVNLISYWELEEASGIRLDSHGVNHLADNNTVTQAAGKIGNAGQFVGGSSEFLSGAGEQLTGDFTISTWIYPDTLIGNTDYGTGIITNHNSEAAGDWAVTSTSLGAVVVYHWSSAGADLDGKMKTTTTPITATAWHHILFRRSGSTYTVWVNGTSLAFTTASTITGWGALGLSIGKHYTGVGYYWNGRIDESAIWARALSDTEIADVYAAGAGLGYPHDITPIEEGGTGQITATAAFDALAPTTTQGDLIYHNGTDNVRLAKGTAGQQLTMNGGATAPEWAAAGGGSTPTGTGFRYVTAGVEDAAAHSIVDGDVPNTITIDLAATATALAANGANCADATHFAVGVNASGVAECEAIAAGDVPTLNQNTTGTAANVTGTVAIANGGTGQTTQTAAFDALAPTSLQGDLIYYDGTDNVRLLKNTTTTTYLSNTGTLNNPAWAQVALSTGITGTLPVLNGGTSNITEQGAINRLTNVAAAVNEHVLTKDTATGDAIFKVVPSGGTVPSGTGFRHVTTGTEDAAAKLVDVADLSVAFTLPIVDGGTGQTAAPQAFDALSPNTTIGDLISHAGGPSNNLRIPIGTGGQVLIVGSTGANFPEWTTLSVRLAANSALSTTTKTNLTGMAFTLAANTHYTFDCSFWNTSNATAVGVQFAVTFTGTTTEHRLVFRAPSGVSPSTVATTGSNAALPISFDSTTSQGNQTGVSELEGWLNVSGTGGVLQFQHGSETATLTTVLGGSRCNLQRY